MRTITLYDSTLRDGNHALKHAITQEQIENYAKLAQDAGVDIIEVGHGNGLGGSSLQVGTALLSDTQMIESAKKYLSTTRLAALVLPGFASLKREVSDAISSGVDIFRVGVHCSEVSLSIGYADYIKSAGKELYVSLMMSHMLAPEALLEQALLAQSYGADGLFLFDSAGYMTPSMVHERVSLLVQNLSIPVAFHAHNNMGLAVANTLESLAAGASLADGCSRGFGAGAGNAPLEIVAALCEREGYRCKAGLQGLLALAEYVEKGIATELPHSDMLSILSGLYGVFSGFKPHVARTAQEMQVEPGAILQELGAQRVIAGQEDMIMRVAKQIKERR